MLFLFDADSEFGDNGGIETKENGHEHDPHASLCCRRYLRNSSGQLRENHRRILQAGCARHPGGGGQVTGLGQVPAYAARLGGTA